MGIGIAIFAVLIVTVVAVGMLPMLSGLAKGAAPLLADNNNNAAGGNNATEAAQGLKALASKNAEMKETMRQEIDQEAGAMIDKCAASGDCNDLGLLKEMCANNNILKLESCSDPRLKELLAGA